MWKYILLAAVARGGGKSVEDPLIEIISNLSESLQSNCFIINGWSNVMEIITFSGKIQTHGIPINSHKYQYNLNGLFIIRIDV